MGASNRSTRVKIVSFPWVGDGIAGGLRDRAQTTTSVVERLTIRQRFISRLIGP